MTQVLDWAIAFAAGAATLYVVFAVLALVPILAFSGRARIILIVPSVLVAVMVARAGFVLSGDQALYGPAEPFLLLQMLLGATYALLLGAAALGAVVWRLTPRQESGPRWVMAGLAACAFFAAGVLISVSAGSSLA